MCRRRRDARAIAVLDDSCRFHSVRFTVSLRFLRVAVVKLRYLSPLCVWMSAAVCAHCLMYCSYEVVEPILDEFLTEEQKQKRRKRQQHATTDQRPKHEHQFAKDNNDDDDDDDEVEEEEKQDDDDHHHHATIATTRSKLVLYVLHQLEANWNADENIYPLSVH